MLAARGSNPANHTVPPLPSYNVLCGKCRRIAERATSARRLICVRSGRRMRTHMPHERHHRTVNRSPPYVRSGRQHLSRLVRDKRRFRSGLHLAPTLLPPSRPEQLTVVAIRRDATSRHPRSARIALPPETRTRPGRLRNCFYDARVMAVRTLTARHLNRAVLARQLLLQRARLPLPRAVERMGGIQAQYAPAAYVALWSRLTRFDRSQLTAALNKPTVVQGTLMRGTIHVVSVDDYPFFAAGVRTARRQWWLPCVEEPRPRHAAICGHRPAASLPARRRSTSTARLDSRAHRRRLPEGRLGGSVPLARHGENPSLGHVGATACRPLRACRRLAHRRAGTERDRWFGAPRAPLSRRLRPGSAHRCGCMGGRVCRRDVRSRREPAAHPPPARRWHRCIRSSPSTASRPGHTRPCALPSDVGRRVARPRQTDGNPSRAVPARAVLHQEPALGWVLPRRRCRSRNVASRRGPGGHRTVRSSSGTRSSRHSRKRPTGSLRSIASSLRVGARARESVRLSACAYRPSSKSVPCGSGRTTRGTPVQGRPSMNAQLLRWIAEGPRYWSAAL